LLEKKLLKKNLESPELLKGNPTVNLKIKSTRTIEELAESLERSAPSLNTNKDSNKSMINML
jgi:hypothetical protein